MRIFGWVVFAIGLILGLFLLPFVGKESYSADLSTTYVQVPYWTLLLPSLCICLGLWLGIRKTKRRSLVCPNGCNITQAGSKFCGLCGARLIWR